MSNNFNSTLKRTIFISDYEKNFPNTRKNIFFLNLIFLKNRFMPFGDGHPKRHTYRQTKRERETKKIGNKTPLNFGKDHFLKMLATCLDIQVFQKKLKKTAEVLFGSCVDLFRSQVKISSKYSVCTERLAKISSTCFKIT